MTNPIKPSAKDIQFWEDMKQEMLDQFDLVNSFEDDEQEAFNNLMWASDCISDDVAHLIDDDVISLTTAASFCASTDKLSDEYKWDTSENLFKLVICKLAVKLTKALRSHTANEVTLSLNNAMRFESVSQRCRAMLRTKPNKYQMKKFEEHGVTWEGEFNDY